MDQRGRDNPPVFFISPQVAGFKYYALLMDSLHVPTRLVMEVYDVKKGTRNTQADLDIPLTMGLYGFLRVEDRDKFCRQCNAVAEAIEHKICVPVTVPGLYMDEPMVTTIRYQTNPATGPVAKEPDGLKGETPNDH